MNANEIKWNEISHLIEKLDGKCGGYENVAMLDNDAYPAKNVAEEFCWENRAVKIEDTTFHVGFVRWDFEKDLEDPSDQNWDFDTEEFQGFYPDEELDMDDEDDLDEVVELLEGALK